LGVGLTTPHRKKVYCCEMFQCVSDEYKTQSKKTED